MQLTTKLLAIVFLLASAFIVKAESPQATIESLATKDLLAVAYLDLNSIEAESCLAFAVEQKLVSADDATQAKQMTGMAQEFLRQATKAGAEQILVLLQQEDLKWNGKPPLIAISVAAGQDPEKTYRSLRRIVGLLQIPDFEMEVWNNTILAGTAKKIAIAKAATVVERPDFVKAWQTFGGRDAGVMIFASPDTRRVIRELYPNPIAPYENVSGELIADHCDSVGISIDLPEKIAGMIKVQTSDRDSAETLKGAIEQVKKMMLAEEGDSAQVPATALAAISALEPTTLDKDVVLDLGPILNDKVMLTSLLKPFQAGGRMTQRMNKLRMVILALHNYESVHRQFPAYANFDEDGKPLLSWRVHILPFLEQGNLYKQFKLDEPWDSPHNIELANTIPDVYADPSLDLEPLNRAGMTRIVLPFAEEAFCHGNEGTKFGSVKDGTSYTIAVVSVPPKHAVVWTRPVDWNVDLENPKDGLFDDENKEAIFAYADGSAHKIESDVSPEDLKALLTKDGGEVIP